MPMDGGAGFRDRMADRARAVRDLAPAFKVIGEEAVRRTAEAFATETAPDGQPWAELASSTVRTRLRQRMTDRQGKARDRAGRFVLTGVVRKLDATGKLKRAALKMQFGVTGVKWFLPTYGRFHLTGTPTMPRRAWTVFEPRPDGGYALEPGFLQYSISVLAKHQRGEPLR
jgi:hypothetical protein